MTGWLLFATLLVYVVFAAADISASWGNAFGYGGRGVNWAILNVVALCGWAVFLCHKFGAIRFWFEVKP